MDINWLSYGKRFQISALSVSQFRTTYFRYVSLINFPRYISSRRPGKQCRRRRLYISDCKCRHLPVTKIKHYLAHDINPSSHSWPLLLSHWILRKLELLVENKLVGKKLSPWLFLFWRHIAMVCISCRCHWSASDISLYVTVKTNINICNSDLQLVRPVLYRAEGFAKELTGEESWVWARATNS